ncbi:patatin-like phospholipase family protein [Pseudomonas sp. Bout1]|uniref:patatin-like phospholipase family protein n=1 Tax=Pseudomonas sp. Bout1 TaxID=3048600 RepID=UPI002AB4910B|nr:patatin-like phospholipase family protein [Pseudomonas sp. Bout1]MDY7535911.1 patatin-like phospholipase family protein [Pseudomonas sp. Bout1]MEB0184757.1 patatin-like phospholipase family protein [Pseudomonas sp. Bout1]
MALLNPAQPSFPQSLLPAPHDIVGSGLAAARDTALAPIIERHGHATVEPQGTKTSLVDGAGERKLALSRYPNGVVEVTVSPPPITQLVLSGGGAKGIAYPGVVQALEDANALKHIRSISGSSAGGISAALLASGMGAKAFDTLSDNLELPKLMNSKHAIPAWLQNASSSVGKVAGKVSSLAEVVFNVLPRLGSKAEPLEDLVREESRKTVLAHIGDLPRELRTPQVLAIADKLGAGGATTFGDLQALSLHIPAIKELNITGTGLFDGRPQLVVFNANLTPDMDIARAAHISGALPLVFKAPEEKGHGFQADGEKTFFQDGGLLLNTPVADFYQRTFPGSAIADTEQLILKFSGDKSAAVRGSHLGSLKDSFLGIPNAANSELMASKLSRIKDQTVVMPLKTEIGDFSGFLNGTINFTMPLEVKNQLQELSRAAVNTHLEKRSQVREQHSFSSIDSAVLAMSDSMLASVKDALDQDDASRSVLRFRSEARQGLGMLDKAVASANTGERLHMTPELASALRNLDALASRPEYVEWLGARLNDAGNPNFQQLLQAPHQTASRVLASGISEMKKRDIAVIADNFTREVLYPSLFRPGQPDSNVALLRRVEHNLGRATTPAQVNQALDDIVDNYVARNKPWSQPGRSTTVEMAKAWRLAV